MTFVKKQPKTAVINVVDNFNGTDIIDPYRWLEEDSLETHQWIKRENSYTKSIIDRIPEKEKYKKRLEKLYHVDSVGIPVPRRKRYFYLERKGSEDLAVLYVQIGLKGKPKVLIDQNSFSKDKTTVLKTHSPSWNGDLLAYGISQASNDQQSIYVMDTDTGKNLSDIIPAEVYPGSIAWKPDDSGFLYTRRHTNVPEGEEKFHKKLYFHSLGNNFENDQLIYGENLAKEDMPTASISRDDRYLLVTVHIFSSKKEKTEVYFKDLRDKKSKFIPVVKGVNASFYASIQYDTIFVITNYKAPQWKIMSVNVKDIPKGIKGWKNVIQENKKCVINNYRIVQNLIFVVTLENIYSKVKVYSLEGKFINEISLPSIGSVDSITGEQDGHELFLSFSSYLIPTTIYRYDLKSCQLAELKRVRIGIPYKLFTVKQIMFSSKDGTKIPMFLVHKNSIKLTGNNPTLVYGYGGFNADIKPGFNRTIIPFLEDGGIYVDVNLRGGGEFGEKWHKAGMKDKKQNVFDDFIAATQWLIENNYTNPTKLSIFGWSNGGLLVGAAITQHPELFKVAVIGAPVADMLRYHLFYGGRLWIQEYGIADHKNEFKYLLKYSPYHNVRDGKKYPAVLILTADKDDRVHPMHAFKLSAKLQHSNASDNPILIRIEAKAGHSGAASIRRYIEQSSDMWGFIYWQLGMTSNKEQKL